MERQYIAIDLKSFYASVECVERGLDPLTTNLVVADQSRTEKTICLAVTPSLKAYGIPGRARLFEVIEKVRQVNFERKMKAPRRTLTGESYLAGELETNPSLGVSYIVAPPQMAKYMSISTKMYEIYLGFVAPEDIFAYSVDEVFIDATPYLSVLRCTARELAMRMIREVLRQTGITATAGIGTNLYLCKIAMDIMAKKMPSDADGVRIAELTELSYRENLWEHRPLTSFWRVGAGIAAKLESHGMFTMGDVARCSLVNEELLYRLFGVNAELLIDHAWGYEPCLLSDVKAYKPETNSVSMGQVLNCPYTWEKARLIVREMVDLLALDLVDKGLVTDSLVLDIGYDTENLADPALCRSHTGEIVTDAYGRKLPKHAHGTARLPFYNASTMRLTDAAMTLFDRITEPRFTVRRMSITACHVISEGDARMRESVDGEQMDLFTDYDSLLKKQEAERASLLRERAAQDAILSLRRRYGKNAVLRGINYLDGATMRERNRQIGGHRM